MLVIKSSPEVLFLGSLKKSFATKPDDVFMFELDVALMVF